jgi:hypothetical protein
MVAYPV